MQYTFQFQTVWSRFDLLLQGVWLTIQLSLITLFFGVLIGIVAARLITTGSTPVRLCIRGYVEAIRNTPLLVQLFLVFFGLPAIGIRLDANFAAMIPVTINMGAYSCEIVRAGIEVVHEGQLGRAHA